MTDPLSVDELMDILSPRGMSKIAGVRDQQMTLQQNIRLHIVDKQKKFVDLKRIITNYFSPGSGDKANEKDEVSYVFHGISLKNGTICNTERYADTLYWINGSDKSSCKEIDDGIALFKSIFPELVKDNPACDISIMTTTDPYISPTDARTEDVELFFNYTPAIVANQMQPYLEIEFVNNKKIAKEDAGKPQDGLFHLSTPSILRFMLGSIDSKGASFASSDRSLLRISKPEESGNFFSAKARSGMEMFLMPQSFSNMSSYKSQAGVRLVDTKPFVPFASIMGFEVNILNAGAGAMAHKTATLNLTIHDKGRLSEISEFIRGPAGYGSAQIWTSYGWLAPRRPDDPEEADDYAKFINDTMHMEDCWQVKNTQFSFDNTGKVNLTLDLVSFGVVEAKRSTIKLAGEYESYLRGFEDMMKSIAESSQGILSSPLGPDARIVQIVNAGSTGQLLPGKVDDPDKLISEVVRAYARNAELSEADVNKLVNNLQIVLNPKRGRSELAGKRLKSIAELVKDIKGTDPFLPLPKTSEAIKPPPADRKAPKTREFYQPSEDYFTSDFIKELRTSAATIASRSDKLPNGAKPDSDVEPRPAITLDPSKKIMSFGKIFCSLALPAFLEANKSIKGLANAEVQVIFYALNDECGPVSGASVAEFPIDVERLLYSLDDVIKAKNRADLTIEEFLRLVVNNQFNDDRSIGFGMLNAGIFEPWHRDKTGIAKQEKDPKYETNLAAWQAKYPGFRRPIIEMSFETSKVEDNTASRIHNLINSEKKDPSDGTILRIHIYDKQNNPRKLFSQFVEIAGEINVGAFNETELRKILKSKEPFGAVKDRAGSRKLKDFIEQLGKASGAGSEDQKNADRQKQLEIGKNAGVNLRTPNGEKVMKIERSLFGPNGFRAALQRMVPTIIIGTNGTLVKTVNIQSKTDDLMAAANLVNIMKPKAGGSANSAAPPNNLEGPGGMPLRAVPAAISMTSLGCPAARLYQQYFIDLGTGTSLDNLYTCTNVTHKLSQGKFESVFTFAFTDGYGKFTAPPTIAAILKKAAQVVGKIEDDAKAKPPTPAPAPGAPPPKPGSGQVKPAAPGVGKSAAYPASPDEQF